MNMLAEPKMYTQAEVDAKVAEATNGVDLSKPNAYDGVVYANNTLRGNHTLTKDQRTGGQVHLISFDKGALQRYLDLDYHVLNKTNQVTVSFKLNANGQGQPFSEFTVPHTVWASQVSVTAKEFIPNT